MENRVTDFQKNWRKGATWASAETIRFCL